MSSTTLPPAALQYNFEHISGNTLPNLTGSEYNGTIGSGVSRFTDPEFGECLNFENTGSISIPSLPGTGLYGFSQGLTMTGWIYLSRENETDGGDETTIFSLGAGTNGAAQLNWGGTSWLFVIDSNGGASSLVPESDQGPGNWVYVAFTLNQMTVPNLYVYGGGVWSTRKGTPANSPISGVGTGDNLFGKVAGSGIPGFIGKLAWFSIYNSVLPQELLEQDMILGKLQGITSYRKTLPLTFSLTSDNNGHNPPVLFIEKVGQGKKMNLAITNTASGNTSISIPTATAAVSANYYQFQLRFKPGVLSTKFLSQPKPWTEGKWSIGVYTDDKTGEACLNIVNTGSKLTLLVYSVININLGQVNAGPLGGARNTSVLFQYEGLIMGANKITGHRKQSLSIISHLGQKDIPLQVGVLGAPRILNNGTTTELIIRVQNIDPTANIDLESVIEQKKAAFEVGFLIQAENQVEEWALIDHKEGPVHLDWPVIGVIELAADKDSTTIKLDEPLTRKLTNTTLIIDPVDGTKFNVTIDGTAHIGHQTLTLQSPGLQNSVQQGAVVTLASNQTDWTQTNNGATSGYYSWTVQYHGNGVLAPGDSIDFLLKDIQCKLPAGQAFITLKYFNLGGYWDGEFTTAVEKSLISVNETTVGIGIIEDDLAPDTVLQVPFTPGSANVGLLVGGDTSYGNGGLTSAINIAPNHGTDSADGAGNALIILGNEGVLFQLRNNGSLVIDSNQNDNNAINIGYPVASTNPQAITNGIVISSAENSSIGVANVGLGISAKGQSTGTPLYIEDTNGNQALKVSNEGITTAKEINASSFRITGSGTSDLGTISADQLTITGADTSSLGTIEAERLTISGTQSNALGAITANSVAIDYPSKGDYGFCVGTWPQGALAGAISIAIPNTASTNAPPLNFVNAQSKLDIFTVFANGQWASNMYITSGYKNILSVSPYGLMGLGTTAPVATFDVESFTPTPGTGYNLFGGKNYGAKNYPIGINTSGTIAATTYLISSDARIKQLQGNVDTKESLELINQVQIKEYQHIDTHSHGVGTSKGVVAQELKGIMPSAVNQSTDYIPDIYTEATSFKINLETKELQIALDKPHGLKIGDFVKIASSSNTSRHEVTEVSSEQNFTVSDWEHDTKEVFVYGKRIDDFHKVDYGAVSIVGISAIQQLSKEVGALKAENASLKQQLTEGLAELRKEIEALKRG